MRKGDLVNVKGPAGKDKPCPLVLDPQDGKIWVRFPHHETVEMRWDPKREVYAAKVARLEFTVKPQ